MKKYIVIVIVLIVNIVFAASNVQNELTPNKNGATGDTNGTLKTDDNIEMCSTYEECLQQGLQDRENEKESVLLFYLNSNKDIKYNLFDNISVKLSGNICPPVVNVYKTINNINFLMDVFSRNNDSGCITYYSSISGDGRNRDAIIGQLEINLCDKEELFETCDNTLIYGKINMFESAAKKKEKEDQNNIKLLQNSYLN
ncbi:MAG TPA: hypothetical protein HA306_08350, partial [Methanosarcina sp.]|nr:hypothetical protein [Methanosarcina sp.]